jgi:lysophospholipase L1-like esterase
MGVLGFMKRVATVVIMILLLAGLRPVSVTQGQAGGVNLSTVIFLGDSLTAGFQNGAIHRGSQQSAFPNIVINVIKTLPRGNIAFISLPLIAEPGLPTPDPQNGQGLLIQQPNTCSISGFDLATGRTTGRLNPMDTPTNLAVPGQGMRDAVEKRWEINHSDIDDSVKTYEDLILGFPFVMLPEPRNQPKSQLETAVFVVPTTLFIWLGTNDILKAALSPTANSTTLISEEDFNRAATTLFTNLGRTGAVAIVSNIPDITTFPFFFSEEKLENITGLDAAKIKKLFGVKTSDYVTLTAFSNIKAIMSGTAQGPLPPEQILTKKEIKLIRKSTDKFNQTISDLTKRNNWVLMDTHLFFQDLAKTGLGLPNIGTLTTALFGGIFGADGIHFNRSGNAVFANQVIKAGLPLFPDVVFPNISAIIASDPELCIAQSTKTLTVDDLVKVTPAARAAVSTIVQSQTGL